jgi:glucose/arabinose dehydrogenase
MNTQTNVNVATALGALYLALAVLTSAAGDVASGWDPNAFRDLSTLQIMTIGPDEGEHWSRLWLVVIDGQLYVRLGNRAYQRVQKNTSSPFAGAA